MEELIARYPEQFFPRHQFTLQGRQQSFKGVGRFDLLFNDVRGTPILVELKAVPVKFETVDQICRYRDALQGNGLRNVILWLVAPKIPPAMRDFLDHNGIQYSEIHEGEFRQVAAANDYRLRPAGYIQETITQKQFELDTNHSGLKSGKQASTDLIIKVIDSYCRKTPRPSYRVPEWMWTRRIIPYRYFQNLTRRCNFGGGSLKELLSELEKAGVVRKMISAPEGFSLKGDAYMIIENSGELKQ